MLSRRYLANAIRFLSMDAVQKANSGHPGMPMGMADIAEVLWNDFLTHNPRRPDWVNRDRFVLSNGHGSMLLYSLLHLSGYDLSIDELKRFRQLNSKTPGHPERGDTPGVETTTGPLGQGIANAVGMALAEKMLAGQFNRPSHQIVDHYTYTFVGDGCLMEGISHEVCSLAGTLKLGKLIAFYDDNGISIDGEVAAWFSDNTPQRFEAYGWHVVPDVDGHDPEAVKKAIEAARAEGNKPSLICCKTEIAFGAPTAANTSKAHGAPLGDAEIALVREQLGWAHAPFVVPNEIYAAWDNKEKGSAAQVEWEKAFAAYKQDFPELAAEFERRQAGKLPSDWDATLQKTITKWQADANAIATRKASLACLNVLGPLAPELVGGSADLSCSNLTEWSGAKAVTGDDARGNYIYYGVREFGMSAIMNGLALHGGFIPYGGTFLVFSDYARNALRLAALMGAHSIFVYTHDSIGLGEDGPTHQPIEHLSSLRMMPNMSVWRPCDAVETAVAWQAAIERKQGPSSLLFSRQTLSHQARDASQVEAIKKGGYILRDCDGEAEAIIIATGSEVELAVGAAEHFAEVGRHVRVVSMPSVDVFLDQDADYREAVLPSQIVARVAVEAGVSSYWYQFVGLDGRVIGIDSFGASAPGKEVYEHVGLTLENIVSTVNELLEN